MTSALCRQLAALKIDPTSFAELFAKWKTGWPREEYEFELFGKDGAYVNPRVDGAQYVLRHVHLQPPRGRSRRDWDRAFVRRGRKTSDRHLVYVTDSRRGHLLIFVLEEPYGHSVALMSNKDDKEAMEKFAIVAENFIIDGHVP